MKKPKTLYRYLPVYGGENGENNPEKYLNEIFLEHKLRFTNVCNFNDPFDCRSVVDLDKADAEDWRTYFYWMEKEHNPRQGEQACAEMRDKWMDLGIHLTKEGREEIREEWVIQRDEWNRDYFACCLSRTKGRTP